MAEAALSGRNREAVEAELAWVERRLGLPAPKRGQEGRDQAEGGIPTDGSSEPSHGSVHERMRRLTGSDEDL
jgi:hypothetical protein